ncbi:TIGR01841 family phasin [Undibacterium sp. SXout20W]|uniref:phasin family protein n=1 Tax=Undibacterium sp. SXout20W TaxID=3413051 RepID=UPI003BF4083E
MPLLHPQISAATQDQIEKQLAAIQAFSSAAFGGLEKIVALNFATAKQAIDRLASNTEHAFNVKAPHELLVKVQEQSTPQIERLLAYGRELATISASFREEVLHLVNPSQASIATPSIIAVQSDVVALPISKEVKPVVKTKAKTKTSTSKATPKAIAKTPVNTQLPLLSEPEQKTQKATKPPAKPASKKVVANAKPATKVAKTSAVKETPKEVVKDVVKATVDTPKTSPKIASKKIAKPAEKSISANAEGLTGSTPKKATPLAKATVTKAAIKKESDSPAVISNTTKVDNNTSEPVAVPKPVAEVTTAPAVEKKSAVKFPAALTQSLQGDKPAFPKTGSRPAFKAKSSPATGAKKRVRQ